MVLKVLQRETFYACWKCEARAKMVEGDPKQQSESSQAGESEERLKYLDFVQVATLHFVACFSSLYKYAKENSGPLKPGVQTVEDTVKTVIGPVYEKFHGLPLELLKFVDHKVESVMNQVDHHVPTLVKTATCHAIVAAQKSSEAARSVASEINRVGVVETATEIAHTAYTKGEPIAKDLYYRYEPVAEQYAVVAWHKLNDLPLFPQLAQIVVPTAAYWAERYNRAVLCTAERGYVVSQYLPVVPVERIAKVFSGEEKTNKPETATATAVSAGGEQ